jgi:pimeloyl-ACP methyl ester carboxylesterase
MHTPDFSPEKSTIVRLLQPRPASPAPPAAPGAHWIIQHCPRLAALVLAELFVAPRKRVTPFAPPPGAELQVVHAGKHLLRVHLLGQGPLVLLLHDWQSGGSQLARLAQGLANAGLRIALFDMPAHGQSSGLTSDLNEFLETTAEVALQLGPVHGLVGHGLGGLAALLCASRGLDAASVVAVAPVPSFEFAVQQFARSYGLQGRAQELLTRRLERRVGLNRRDASLGEITPAAPTLIVHDVLDRSVSVRHSRQLTSSWRSARLMETCGLGHQRILNAPPVIHFVGNFLRGFPPPRSC